jgi:hypothetical protein
MYKPVKLVPDHLAAMIRVLNDSGVIVGKEERDNVIDVYWQHNNLEFCTRIWLPSKRIALFSKSNNILYHT